jgi:spore maturation protein A
MGLGNAATPLGLKAMKSLQELNPKKDTASRSMITFLVLNTSGITIIPTTVITLRMMYGSISPTDIVFPCIMATFLSTFAGLLMDRFLASRWKK